MRYTLPKEPISGMSRKELERGGCNSIRKEKEPAERER